jgi:hypothetical protein
MPTEDETSHRALADAPCAIRSVMAQIGDPSEVLPLAMAVVWWSDRGRIWQQRFGVLEFEVGLVALYDRHENVRFHAAVRDLAVGTIGRSRIRLTAPTGAGVYVMAMTSLASYPKSMRLLVERHRAIVTPPKPPGVAERSWHRVTQSSHSPISRYLGILTQRRISRPYILAMLYAAGAPVAADLPTTDQRST